MRNLPDLSRTDITVMTMNLRFGLADDGPDSWPLRKSAFPELLAQHKADFICVQEANAFQIDFLKELLPDHGHVGQREPAPSFWQNNVIFFHRRWECRRRWHLFLSPTPTIPSRYRDSRWPRQCTIGQFQKGSRQLVCVDTHFDFSPEVQALSAAIIMDQLAQIDPSLPTIICGDFNAVPSAPCHTVFTGEATGHAAGDSRHFRNIYEDTRPGTHHGFTGRGESRYIDWILFRGQLELKARRVVRDKFNNRFPSDHFPVMALFSD
jgi:endonuclease/exonuclease/phosphatase family metal-dependent hydrolase